MKCSIIMIGPTSRYTSSAYCWSKFVCDVDPGWPRPSAKCAGIPPKRYRPSPSCWLSAWCYPRGSLARSPECNPIENLWHNIKQTANKVKDGTSLEEFQRILQRGLGPTWINFAYKLWSTVCWRGVARWSKQMEDLSVIEHFIHCDAY